MPDKLLLEDTKILVLTHDIGKEKL